MKTRNKGKVHPFTSSSSPNKDAFSVLNLLPAAILTLVSLLSLEDRQVLAYMITRSLNSSFITAQDKKKSYNKQCFDGHGHKSPPLFDCDCFHCYTSFWVRWDSSTNRELIHQAIEAFEEHLNNGEELKNKNTGNGKNKRKEKINRRKSEMIIRSNMDGGGTVQFPAVESPPEYEETVVVELPAAENEVIEVVAPAVVVRNHKGLARKVLPDVMGIFSSRLWSLWSPNV